METVMRRLLTGYAVTYNRRHRRHGHLFQNRYKSILCQEDPYLLELVRYIHLNPLRSKIVTTVEELDRYPYCGHSILMGKRENVWQESDAILSLFGKRVAPARRRYRTFLEEGVTQGKRSELTGGGLVRSAGGWTALKSLRRGRPRMKGDERILGDSDFVEHVLGAANEDMERRYMLQSQGFNFDKLVQRVADLFAMESIELLLPGKQPSRVEARSLLCYWAVRKLGFTATEVSRRLGVSQPSVSISVMRGEKIAAEGQFKLVQGRKL